MRVAVLGSGPAGFYAAQALLRRFPEAKIDLLERLPTPFGLVRYGVAPDHPSTRNAISQFSALVTANPGLSFYGNLPISTNRESAISFRNLSQFYDVTILATGAAAPRKHPAAQSAPPGRVHSASSLALWFNAHPDYHESGPCAATSAALTHTLRNSTSISVIGAGNVALDVARILLRPREDLIPTDMSRSALSILESSPIQNVNILARRSPKDAAWTPAALREIVTKIPGIVTRCDLQSIHQELELPDLSRKQRRTLDILAKNVVDVSDSSVSHDSNILSLTFNRQVSSFFLTDKKAVKMTLKKGAAQEAEGLDCEGNDEMSTDAVFLSLGFEGGTGVKGSVSVGWANGKASGIIGENKWDAETVIANLPEPPQSVPSKPGIAAWLEETDHPFVSWEGWLRIDAEEKRRASYLNLPCERVRIESAAEMVDVATASGLSSD